MITLLLSHLHRMKYIFAFPTLGGKLEETLTKNGSCSCCFIKQNKKRKAGNNQVDLTQTVARFLNSVNKSVSGN